MAKALTQQNNIQQSINTDSSETGNQSFTSHALAPVQRETLEFLRRFIADNGYGPTLKDIAKYIGVRSPSTAHFHLSRLEDKGFVVRGEDGSITLLEQKEISINHGPISVPLLGLIAAGHPIEAIEDKSVMVDIPPQFLSTKNLDNRSGGSKNVNDRPSIYCLQVTGDSMIDAHIMDGDLIIVKSQNVADDGNIVVALLEDGSATLKTFRRLKGGKIMLVPHNPNHKPITLDSVDIQGRIIGLVREM